MNEFFDLKQLEEHLHEIVENTVMIIPVPDGYRVITLNKDKEE